MFEQYNRYKDSGIEWLGKIPEDWELDRIKNIGSVRARVGWKALKASEYVEKSKYIFIATPNIKYKEIDFKNVNYLTKERYEESPEIMLTVGDILLTKDGSTLGTINIVKYLPSKTTVNSSIAVLRFKTINHDFVFYQIKSTYIQNIIQLKKDGAGVPHLFQKDINNFTLLLPKLATQKRIVTYLDKEIQKIDKDIVLLEQKVERYKELKETLVNEVVLRGLDKEVKLKDSGIVWMGNIPNSWQVMRLKELVKTIISGGTPTSSNELYWSNGTINWCNIRDMGKNRILLKTSKKITQLGYINKNLKMIPCETILYSIYATLGRVNITQIETTINQAILAIFENKRKVNKYYLAFYLEVIEKNIMLFANFNTQYNLNADIVKRFNIVVPPIVEQIKIVNYLNVKTQKIDKIVKTIETKIELQKEFRKTLINDVVTGKVKV